MLNPWIIIPVTWIAGIYPMMRLSLWWSARRGRGKTGWPDIDASGAAADAVAFGVTWPGAIIIYFAFILPAVAMSAHLERKALAARPGDRRG